MVEWLILNPWILAIAPITLLAFLEGLSKDSP